MREILFRGKDLNNEWVYGYFAKARWYLDESNISMIISTDSTVYPASELGFVRVDPETVGQWTGRLDRNGRKIYEGDILRVWYPSLENDSEIGGYVKYNVDEARYSIYVSLDSNNIIYDDIDRFHDRYEVIGNIYDNQELVKGKE